MRLWTIHPKYLDSKGLVALWREALLAQKVLKNETKGYRKHPQLIRFQNTENPMGVIGNYLEEIYKESMKRGYHFTKSKINRNRSTSKIKIQKGQLIYELYHLKKKLKNRDLNAYQSIITTKHPDPNPIFEVIDGGIESWEDIDSNKVDQSHEYIFILSK